MILFFLGFSRQGFSVALVLVLELALINQGLKFLTIQKDSLLLLVLDHDRRYTMSYGDAEKWLSKMSWDDIN